LALVLIVDDSPTEVHIMQKALEQHGFSTIAAADGTEGSDLVAPSVMLALAFGRIGCFMNGCCHGKPGTSFLCLSFPSESPAWHAQKKPYGQRSEAYHSRFIR